MDRRLLLPFVVAAVLGAPVRAAAPPIDTLRAQIAQHGAKATVEKLYAAKRWEPVLAQIHAGHEGWIDLAPSLAVGTDAATSEGLVIALATALPNNAAAVLSVVVPGSSATLGVGRVCSAPFIKDTVDVVAYRVRALKALARTPDAPLRAACITALRTHG